MQNNQQLLQDPQRQECQFNPSGRSAFAGISCVYIYIPACSQLQASQDLKCTSSIKLLTQLLWSCRSAKFKSLMQTTGNSMSTAEQTQSGFEPRQSMSLLHTCPYGVGRHRFLQTFLDHDALENCISEPLQLLHVCAQPKQNCLCSCSIVA